MARGTTIETPEKAAVRIPWVENGRFSYGGAEYEVEDHIAHVLPEHLYGLKDTGAMLVGPGGDPKVDSPLGLPELQDGESPGAILTCRHCGSTMTSKGSILQVGAPLVDTAAQLDAERQIAALEQRTRDLEARLTEQRRADSPPGDTKAPQDRTPAASGHRR